MTPTLGAGLALDVARLIDTRLLVQSNSGGGKSWALRRLLEQTANHVQQIILDTEGEFASLRERFDYVICAPHGADAVATPATAALLARRIRESRVSAIIDLYDLKMHDRRRFVRLFLEELIDAPKAHWHPALTVVDEAHLYCPEKGEAESAAAVIDLSSRGRKRGLCAILATQRLSKLHKDAAAELLNKMIGRTGLDIDVKRAADELGMNVREATTTLRNLDPGEFYCFGPALSKAVTKITVGAVSTKHPKSGERIIASPPASEKIRKLLSELADLPKEAEQEARTLDDLRRENTNLKRELTLAKRAQPIDPGAIDQARAKGKADGYGEALKQFSTIAGRVRSAVDSLRSVADDMGKVEQDAQPAAVVYTNQPIPNRVIAIAPANLTNGSLPGPQQRILNAIAWFEGLGIDAPELSAVAFLAGYTAGGGAFNNPRSALRSAGLIEYRGDRLTLTDQGRALAEAPTSALTNAELHARVFSRLPGPERKILAAVIDAYPDDVTDADLAARTAYTAGGGAFNNPKSRLRTLGLIVYPAPKRVRAADLLFPIS